jgi:integrase
LKHAKLWYGFADDYKALKNTKPPAGQALTGDDQARLFEVAKWNPAWFFAYVAATLDFFRGLRACEIKGLQWKHVSWDDRRLSVRRSKTSAGWRDPSLNETCLQALRELHRVCRAIWDTTSLSTSSSVARSAEAAGPYEADDILAHGMAVASIRLEPDRRELSNRGARSALRFCAAQGRIQISPFGGC